MPRCRNKSCQTNNGKRARLPKDALPPLTCSDACQKAVIAEAIAGALAAKERSKRKAKNTQALEEKARRKSNRRKRSDYWASQLPHQIKLTQDAFNKLVRLLDRGKSCPTCDEPLVDGDYHAGHVRTVASCPHLRFNALACFGQCASCNKSGTIRKRTKKTQEVVSEIYKAWILKTFGQAYHDWLYGFHASQDWDCEQLEVMRKEFAAETRRIEKGLSPLKNWRELPPALAMENKAA
jgi:hypothetical protein